jgi:hypothetical protein
VQRGRFPIAVWTILALSFVATAWVPAFREPVSNIEPSPRSSDQTAINDCPLAMKENPIMNILTVS